MLMVWLGASAGAATWGWVASSTTVRTAMLAAALVNVGIAVVARWLLRIHAAPLATAPEPVGA